LLARPRNGDDRYTSDSLDFENAHTKPGGRFKRSAVARHSNLRRHKFDMRSRTMAETFMNSARVETLKLRTAARERGCVSYQKI
jgi:hypothetical protein